MRFALKLLAALLGAGFLLAVLTSPGTSQSHADRSEDTSNLKVIAQAALTMDRLPIAPDGKLDVFRALLEQGLCEEDAARTCRSARVDRGSTTREIRSGDYTGFPWERARIEDDRAHWDFAHPFPLVWERRPGWSGRIVAYSTGAVKSVSEQKWRELRSKQVR